MTMMAANDNAEVASAVLFEKHLCVVGLDEFALRHSHSAQTYDRSFIAETSERN